MSRVFFSQLPQSDSTDSVDFKTSGFIAVMTVEEAAVKLVDGLILGIPAIDADVSASESVFFVAELVLDVDVVLVHGPL